MYKTDEHCKMPTHSELGTKDKYDGYGHRPTKQIQKMRNLGTMAMATDSQYPEHEEIQTCMKPMNLKKDDKCRTWDRKNITMAMATDPKATERCKTQNI